MITVWGVIAIKSIIYARPSYFDRFQCLADRCVRSCCATGWEIDIDDKSAARYRRMRGPLGRELRENMIYGEDGAGFRITADGRCPFLLPSGLCKLIIERGEGILCGICREHPRFYNLLPHREEVGLSVCCESACALIISDPEPFRIIETGKARPAKRQGTEEEELADMLLSLRKEAIDIVCDREISFGERLLRLCDRYGVPADDPCLLGAREDLLMFLELEPLDGGFFPLVHGISERFSEVSELCFTVNDEICERLLCYFLYRYFVKAIEGFYYPTAYLRFSIASVRFIRLYAGYKRLIEGRAPSFDELVALICDYSDEVECNEKNVECLLGILSEC